MSANVVIQAEELRPALGVLLATPAYGCRAGRAAVRGFVDYLEASPVSWQGWRCGPPTAPTALFLAILLPGSTAIVMVPTPNELGIQPAAQDELTGLALEQLRGRRLHFAQALLLPGADGQRRVLSQAGFQRLASLAYLERDARYPWSEPPPVDEGAWLAFSPQTEEQFAATLQATYRDSLDCPELAELRPVADVIAAHQAAGRFEPRLWELLWWEGSATACLLLAPLTDGRTIELVYMGVVPEYRGRGLGKLLLQRALQQCRAHGARRLTVAVDERNEPAKGLYNSFALRPMARREAYLYRWCKT